MRFFIKMHDVNFMKIMILTLQKCASRLRRVQKMKNHENLMLFYKIVKKQNVVPMQHGNKKKPRQENEQPKTHFLGSRETVTIIDTFFQALRKPFKTRYLAEVAG